MEADSDTGEGQSPLLGIRFCRLKTTLKPRLYLPCLTLSKKLRYQPSIGTMLSTK